MFYHIFFIIIIIILFIIFNYLLTKKYEYFENEKKKYTAIIVEPRKHKALEFVLNNFHKNLDNNWNIIIYHGNLNEEYIDNIIQKNNINRIKKINLKKDNLTIDEYNQLFKDKEFYKTIPTEVFLVFQTDSIICEKYKDNIHPFLQYDYVGAPWKKEKDIGNGGLSLRRKSKMLEIIDKCDDPEKIAEDLFFSYKCKDSINIFKPTFEESKEFSMETIESPKGSFGIHKAWLYLDNDMLERKCPGTKKLAILNQ